MSEPPPPEAGRLGAGRTKGAKQAARDSTRAALLAAATRMLFQAPAADVLRTLKPSEVARQADPPRTTGAFYNIWPSQQDFRRDLLNHLLSQDRFGADQDTLATIEDQLARPQFDLTETIRLAAAVALQGNRTDPAFLLQMSLLTHQDRAPDVAEGLRRLYAELTLVGAEAYAVTLQRAGLRLRAPFTLEQFAVALTSLGEGLALRWTVEPEAVPDDVGAPPGVTAEPGRPWSLFAALVHVLTMAMTEPVGPGPDPAEPDPTEPDEPVTPPR